jgi:hypothetical protein
MTRRTLRAAVQAAALIVAAQIVALQASAAIFIPSALVEDVKSTSAGVQFMDYVSRGQVIQLEPSDVLVLSYLKSCEHETITGGSVRIGSEQSEVEGGKVDRAKVPCDGGKMRLSSQQANASAASAIRLQSAATEPVLYALPPMIQVKGGDRTLVIQRVDRPGERYEIQIGEGPARGAFYDLAKADIKPLKRGATYRATLGERAITFKVHPKAKSGKAPIISRLLRFTPG